MTNLQKGILLAFLTAFISGVSNFYNKVALTQTGDPLVFTTLKNSLVGFLLLPIIFGNKSLHFKKSIESHSFGLLAIAIIGGSLPFALYFTGLSYTSAAVASFIHKTLFIWVAFLAVLFLKEKFSYVQLGGFTLLILGSFLFPGSLNFQFNQAELMILAAVILWSLENIIAKKVLGSVNVNLVTSSRMILGSLILFLIVIFQNKLQFIFSLNLQQWFLTIISSLLLFGYVNFWYRALQLAPATLVTSILVLASPITNLLTSLFITHQVNWQLLINFGLITLGGTLIILRAKDLFKARSSLPPNVGIEQ
jgi:drug/metabolite transporter (DMT)-like permease